MRGIVNSAGVFVEMGGGLVPLPATHTPLGEAVAALIAAIDAGAVEPCPVCGRFDCDSDDWHEMHTSPLDADPHGDLSAFAEWELPY